MESLSRPIRKLSGAIGFSSGQNPYDGVFSGPIKSGAPKFSSKLEDYREIFGSSKASSIPFLDLSSLDESDVSSGYRISRPDYSKIFGGVRDDKVALSYEELFTEASGVNSSSDRVRRTRTSTPTPSRDVGGTSAVSDDSFDAMKQINMSYHKTSQMKDGLNGTTHVAELHAVPGFTCFIDEFAVPRKAESKKQRSDEDRKEGKPGLRSGAKSVQDLSNKQDFSSSVEFRGRFTQNGSFSDNDLVNGSYSFKGQPSPSIPDNIGHRVEHLKKPAASNSVAPKKIASENDPVNLSSPFFDDELDENSAAAALKKALEKAQESIRIAKESVGRRKEGLRSFSNQSFKDSLKVQGRSKTAVLRGENETKDISKKQMWNSVSSATKSSTGIERTNEMLYPDFKDGEKLVIARKVIDEIQGKIFGSVKRYENSTSSRFECSENTSIYGKYWGEEMGICNGEPSAMFESVISNFEPVKSVEECEARIKVIETNEPLNTAEAAEKRCENSTSSRFGCSENTSIYGEDRREKMGICNGEPSAMFETAVSNSEPVNKCDVMKSVEECEATIKVIETKELLNTAEAAEKRCDNSTLASPKFDSRDKFSGSGKDRGKNMNSCNVESGAMIETATPDSESVNKSDVMKPVEECKGRIKEIEKREAFNKEQEVEERCDDSRFSSPKFDSSESFSTSDIDSGNMDKSDGESSVKFETADCPSEQVNKYLVMKSVEDYKGIIKERETKEIFNTVEADERASVLDDAEKWESESVSETTPEWEEEVDESAYVVHEHEENGELLAAEEDESKHLFGLRNLDQNQKDLEEMVQVEVEELSEVLRETDFKARLDKIHEKNDLKESQETAEDENQLPYELKENGFIGSGEVENSFFKDSDRETSEKTSEKSVDDDFQWVEIVSRLEEVNEIASDNEHPEDIDKGEEIDKSLEEVFERVVNGTSEEELEEEEEEDNQKISDVAQKMEPDENVIIEGHDVKVVVERLKKWESEEDDNRVREACKDEEMESTSSDTDRNDYDGRMEIYQNVVLRKFKHSETSDSNEETSQEIYVEGGKDFFKNEDDGTGSTEAAHTLEETVIPETTGMDQFAAEEQGSKSEVEHIKEQKSELAVNLEVGVKMVDNASREAEESVEEDKTDVMVEKGENNAERISQETKGSQDNEKFEKNLDRAAEGKNSKEVEEKQHLNKIDEEAKRERREREKERMAVERAIREARERAFAEARERAAVEKAAAEVRQRVMAEAREKVSRASAGKRLSTEKASAEAKLRAERAAVERATSEARERALEKAMSQKSFEAKTQGDNPSGASRENGTRQTSSDLRSSNGMHAESTQSGKARMERHNRIMERAAKALAEKEKRDLLAQKEQAERNRLAETLDADVKRWSSGKEGNLRALLSTLQYILGPDSGWQPVSLTEIITASAVKKAYRKATLCVHPDKLQQRGATIQHKYTCEKVFDLLKAAWNRFNSEER